MMESRGRVYVFGGAGFLGKAFCRAWPTSVPCDSAERLSRAGLHGVEFNFGVDSPAHLPCGSGDQAVIFSWRGYPAAHDADPVGKLSQNLSCTLELVSWLATSGVKGIYYASTGGAIYGNAGSEAVQETTAIDPVGFYGIGKATAEMYVRKLCRESGLRNIIFRIGNAFGPDQIRDNLSVGFVAKAVQSALTGVPLEIWGDGSTRRDYIHADDVAAGFIAAIRNPTIDSGVYNLASGVAVSNLEVVQLVEDILGRKVETVYRSARLFDVARICLDCSNFHRAAGWMPQRSMADAIKEMAKVVGIGN